MFFAFSTRTRLSCASGIDTQGVADVICRVGMKEMQLSAAKVALDEPVEVFLVEAFLLIPLPGVLGLCRYLPFRLATFWFTHTPTQPQAHTHTNQSKLQQV